MTRSSSLVAFSACILMAASFHGCRMESSTDERMQRIEHRLQATEFKIAELIELEPKVEQMLKTIEEGMTRELQKTRDEAYVQIKATREGTENVSRRLEMVEQWIQEKDKEEEQKKLYAVEDGAIPPAWSQLETDCGQDQLGLSQTTLNYLVRVNAYMSDFPVHHPVEFSVEDPLSLMTGNVARKDPETMKAYRDMELHILKSRDRFLGYRIDRSWETRPEFGMCKTACCNVDLEGQWKCDWSQLHDRWGSEGQHSKWECEYDAEGWRDYRARWWRRCDYVAGTREFAKMPYLMRRVMEKDLEIPDPLYCVVDLIWENRIFCLSHSQYPVLQVRLEQGSPEEPILHPDYPRFTLLAIHNWDVLFKDEWSSSWVVNGTLEAEFPGQKTGFNVEVIQTPQCGTVGSPERVISFYQEWVCIPNSGKANLLEDMLKKHGFRSEMDLQIQKTWLDSDPEWSEKLRKVVEQGCPR